MLKMKNVRMRCAFRYLFCVFVGVLTLISIQLAVISDRSVNNLFRTSTANEIFKRNTFERDNSVKEWFSIKSDALRKGKVLTWEDYRKNPSAKTGNTLIDDYRKNEPGKPGENGSAVILVGDELQEASRLIQKYNLNVYASDRIPLNRMVPDARFPGYVTLLEFINARMCVGGCVRACVCGGLVWVFVCMSERACVWFRHFRDLFPSYFFE